MKISCKHLIAALALASAPLAIVESAHAEEFYAGKTVTVVIGSRAGGSFDLIQTPFNPVWSKYIPGNPEVANQFMPGAGGIRAYNWVFNNADPDGLTVVMGAWRPIAHLLGSPDIDFNPADGHMIGARANWNVAVINANTMPDGSKNPADVAKIDSVVVVAIPRAEGSYSMLGRLSLLLMGNKMRSVTGYQGQNNMAAAVVQNEVQFINASLENYKNLIEPTMVEPGDILPLWTHTIFDNDGNVTDETYIEGLKPFHQVYQEVHGELPSGVLWETYKWVSQIVFGGALAVWAPPGTPEDRVEILRKSHAAAVKDPEIFPPGIRELYADGSPWSPPDRMDETVKIFESVSPEVKAQLAKMVDAVASGEVLGGDTN